MVLQAKEEPTLSEEELSEMARARDEVQAEGIFLSPGSVPRVVPFILFCFQCNVFGQFGVCAIRSKGIYLVRVTLLW